MRGQIGTTTVDLGPPRQRCLLAALLLATPRPVTADVLTGCIWGTDPPPRARNLLATYVSRLRRILDTAAATSGTRAPVIPSGDGGYAVRCDPADVDVHLARALADRARVALAAGRANAADDLLTEALALCEGTPLSGLSGEWAERTREQLGAERLGLVVERARLRLDLDRPADVIADLAAEADAHPVHEQLTGQYMLALYRAGRSTEALAAYRRLRDRTREEFGVEPAEDLRRLHQRILQEDPALAGSAGAAPRPAQLPPDVPDFTGRAAEVGRLTDLLTAAGRQARPVVAFCTGSPGAGKTALAVHIGHRLRDLFRDGQLYLNLRGSGAAPAEPADALADLLRTLGVAPAALAADVEGRVRQLRGRLAGRQVLLVLDDAASAEQVRPLLPETPGCAAIVTGRRRLADLAADWTLDLPELTAVEAVTLLASIVGGERCAAERDAAARIVELCGRLPLAVRIAGARLASHEHWKVRRLAHRLADERRRLSELHAGDLAVRVSFAVGYEALPPASRRALCLFAAVQAPDVAGWAVAALLDLPPAEAADVMEHLVDVRLVDVGATDAPGQVRYYCHDLVRLFALERLAGEIDAPSEACAVRRVADAAVELATVAGAELLRGRHLLAGPPAGYLVPDEMVRRVRGAAHEWMMAEQQLMYDLARDANRRGWWAHVCALADRLMYPLEIGGAGPAWLGVQELAVAAAQRGPDRAALARAHTAVAYLQWMRGQWAQAQSHVDAAYEALDRDDGYGWACVAYAHSFLLWERGEWAENFAVLHRCLTIFREAGDTDREARVLCNLGYAHSAQGDFDRALEHLRDSLRLFRSAGFRLNVANLLVQIGAVRRSQGCADDAIDHLAAGLAIFEEYHAQRPQAQALFQLASAYAGQKRYAEAAAALDRGLELTRDFGDTQGEAIILYKMGAVRTGLGEPHEAAAALTDALAIFDSLGARQWQARTRQELGSAYAALGRDDDADREWAAAEGIFTGLGMPEAGQVRLLRDALGHARSNGG